MSKYFVDRSTIFEEERVLEEEYTPTDLPEREDQLERIGQTLSSVINGGTPNNLFLYGKAGQGKTASARFMANDFEELAEENDVAYTTIFQTCSTANTSYQVVCDLVESITGEDPNGFRARKAYNMLYRTLDEIGGTVTLILDEVDNIKDDTLLYELPRARDNGHIEDARVSIIGISNDSTFRDDLSAKVKDSLSDEVIQFPTYQAEQLQSILERRVNKAFVDGAVNESAISLCAAFAAQDKGSARQALKYLYRAGELAANQNDDEVTEAHVRRAEEVVEREELMESMRNLTIQDYLPLIAVAKLESAGHTPVRTREVYSVYREFAIANNSNTIVMRRVRDHLQDLDMLGIVEGNKRTGGSRGGEHWYWELTTTKKMTIEVLEEIEVIADAMDEWDAIKIQSKL